MCSQFANQKASALKGVDLSRKGSVDAPIGDLVQLVNSLPQYFTTSSCSGRIVVLAEDSDVGRLEFHFPTIVKLYWPFSF